MGKLLEIFELNYKMSSLSRYSQTHLIKSESVLEHTGFVSMLSYMIGSKLIEEGIDINMGVLLSKAISHDIDEIITGDIPRPTKYYNEGVRKALEGISFENMKKISIKLEMDFILIDWMDAKIEKEGDIVALCDCLAVVYKVYYEVEMFGNKTINDHLKKVDQYILRMQKNMEEDINGSYFLRSIIKDAIIICNRIEKELDK